MINGEFLVVWDELSSPRLTRFLYLDGLKTSDDGNSGSTSKGVRGSSYGDVR